MPQSPTRTSAGNHGNKYVTAAVLLLIAAGLFVATLVHLVF